ncbi:glycine receptor subunit alpha-2-like isoform X2 [Amphiura filiformis]|uniref:glycine receptor subunit alpha-2-like isoform X2 n=1 Tax=Amphiura filiformis TaxID=82378 RepID=UPI003B20E2ED
MEINVHYLLPCFVCCFYILSATTSIYCSILNATDIIDDLIIGYDSRVRPANGGPAVQLAIGLFVESIDGISEATGDYSLTMFFRQNWNDSRLAYPAPDNEMITLKGNDMDKLWQPDTFFLYEKNAKLHHVTVTNKLMQIFPDGRIWLSTRVSVTLSCNMKLENFPMDSQKCTMNIMSYAYTTEDLELTIKDEDINIENGLSIPRFDLLNHTSSLTIEKYAVGPFSNAQVHFYFQRQMQAFFLTVYIPTVLLVSIAWLSFWIDAKAAPARVALGITTVLTVTTMTAGIQETLPVVTYAKAIDVWLATCLIFVFTSLLEYGFANYLLVVENRAKAKRKKCDDIEAAHPANNDVGKGFRQLPPDENNTTGPVPPVKTLFLTSGKLDAYARMGYPLGFAIFNIIYWVYYLSN